MKVKFSSRAWARHCITDTPPEPHVGIGEIVGVCTDDDDPVFVLLCEGKFITIPISECEPT